MLATSSLHSADETTSLVTLSQGEIEHAKRRLQRQKRYSRRYVATVGLLAVVGLFVFILFVGKTKEDPQQGSHDYDDDNKKEEKSNNNTITTTTSSFPSDFVWGSATSSYQVEGATKQDGRGMTIWDTFCHQGGGQHVLGNASGDIACDHYHLYKQDVQLMKDLHLQAYRFSIAWSRILPHGYYYTTSTGEAQIINQAGIDFYNNLIDTLLSRGIQPWITLYHWDLPQTLQDEVQGWLDHPSSHANNVVNAFGDYARICFEAFGDRVKHWITINEPWTVAVHGYNDGIKAPGRHHNGTYETYMVAHNLLLAHARAATIYKQEFQTKQGGMIGLSNSADYRYPLMSSSQDEEAAERAMLFQFGWFMEPLMTGDYPAVMKERVGHRLPKFTTEQRQQLMESCDFLGINTYSSAKVSNAKQEPTFGGYWADIGVITTTDPSWDKNYMGWPIVPDATRELLLWISQRYNYPLLYITENGSAEEEDSVEDAQHDVARRAFFQGHLRACRQALEAGVRLGGYFAWSLMDNFEWEYGYQRRFGICYVDFDTQVRTPKSSGLWYSETIQSNGANID